MRNARHAGGWSLLGAILLACGAGASHAGATPSSSLSWAEPGSLKQVARGLRGEWEGQIEVRAADGSLSTSLASMSVRPNADGNSVEIYYEGFAFGKPVDGAMVLSYGSANEQASFRDNSVQIRGNCSPTAAADEQNAGTLTLSGRTDGKGREIRTHFNRHSADSWSIQYQAKDQNGDWAPILTLHMDRMEQGQRSAAADGFDSAGVVAALRETVSASVDADH